MTDFKKSQIIRILEEQKSKSNKERYDYDINEAYSVVINLLKAHDLTNEIIYCRDCKYWKDSDGVYRRGINAESNCPINSKTVYEGNGFCHFAERKDENLKEDKVKKYEEAIQNIKEEINGDNINYFIAVQSVLDIINKHTKEITT